MKSTIYRLLVLVVMIGIISCNQIKNKTTKITVTTKEELKNQTQKIVEEIFPVFDYDKPDTKNNKKRFKDFLKIEITPDVKNIYCFDDTIGIDADYMFAFNCNSKTSNRIIEAHNLVIDTINLSNGFEMQHDFEWWDKKRIKNLQKYSWTDNNQYFKYYWYDGVKEKAYFFDFDM